MNSLPLPDQHYTYADYLGWPDEPRVELIHGQVYAMSPAPGLAHQSVSGELFRQIANHLLEHPCRVFAAPFDVRLPRDGQEDEQTDTVVQPDLLVVCDSRQLDERGCRGAPDWIIEILSPATAAKDQTVKLALYEGHGVKAYWLVHPTDRVVTLYRLNAAGRYDRPAVYETRGPLAVGLFPEFAIDWDRVFPGE